MGRSRPVRLGAAGDSRRLGGAAESTDGWLPGFWWGGGVGCGAGVSPDLDSATMSGTGERVDDASLCADRHPGSNRAGTRGVTESDGRVARAANRAR